MRKSKYLFVVIAGLVLVSCGKKDDVIKERISKTETLTMQADIAKGSMWDYKIDNESIIEIEDIYVKSECINDDYQDEDNSEMYSNNMFGTENITYCGGNQVFTIKGLKEGITTIEFIYKDRVNSENNKTIKYTYKVNSNKDVEVVNNE